MSKKFLSVALVACFGITVHAQQQTVQQPLINEAAIKAAEDACKRWNTPAAGMRSCVQDTIHGRSSSTSGGGSCESYRDRISDSKSKLCEVCASTGMRNMTCTRDTQPERVEGLITGCKEDAAKLGKCQNDFARAARQNQTTGSASAINLQAMVSSLSKSSENCEFLWGQSKDELKGEMEKLDGSFKDNDEKRRTAEEKYFDKEAKTLEEANRLQGEINKAQQEAEATQRALQKTIREIFGERDQQASQLRAELEKLNSAEEDLKGNAAKFIQDEFENSKRLLEYSCMDKAKAQVAQQKLEKATKTAAKQWKFNGITNILQSGVGYKNLLNNFGKKAYEDCKKGGTDFVKGFQDALTNYKQKIAKRESDLKSINDARARIEEGLKALEERANDKQKEALEEGNAAWKAAQNNYMMVQKQLQDMLRASVAEQQRNVSEITLYRGLAEQDKRNYDIARAGYQRAKAYKPTAADDADKAKRDTVSEANKLGDLIRYASTACCDDEDLKGYCKTRPATTQAPPARPTGGTEIRPDDD